jgi:pyruvate/2-oxoglutarate/acetoin dehydrogenase E1 component
MSAAPEVIQTISFTDAYRIALDESMAADPSVFLLGEDIADEEGGGPSKVTQGLSTKYGCARVRTTPISEQAIIGAAIGASLAGMRPVAEIMKMNFIAVAMDQIVNHAAKLRFMSGGQTNVPITIRTRTGAANGGGGQHSDYLEAWFAHVAGIKVVMPSSPADGTAATHADKLLHRGNRIPAIQHTFRHGALTRQRMHPAAPQTCGAAES